MSRDILIFGFGRFGKDIYNTLYNLGYTIRVRVLDSEQLNEAKELGVDVDIFDIYSDESIKKCGIERADFVICAIDDSHKNMFLSLSIRELYKSAYIIAISTSLNLTNKYKIIGVNRVIDMYSLSGMMIKNILYKPHASKFLQGFLDNSHPYIFYEYKVEKDSSLIGKSVDEIEFDKYDIIFVGMVDLEKGKNFIFYTLGKEHIIDIDDILVLVGKEENINSFIKANKDR